jgi:transposase
MVGTKRQYTAEFKREAVQLITVRRLSVAEAARSLGVKTGLLYRWKREVQADGAQAFPGPGQVTGVEAELQRLRTENERLRMERDILKKATAFFAKESR